MYQKQDEHKIRGMQYIPETRCRLYPPKATRNLFKTAH